MYKYCCSNLGTIYAKGLLMQIVVISVIYPSSSKFIFTKATKCVVQSDF